MSHSRNLQFLEVPLTTDDLLVEVLQGLSQKHRRIPCKFLYDKTGSEIFSRITELPEYYPTRTETQLLRQAATEIGSLLSDCTLIEFGSGNSQKSRILLDASQLAAYAAVDVSREYLEESCRALSLDYPRLPVFAICADFTKQLTLPAIQLLQHRRVVFFPGSSIGNFEPEEAAELLRNIATLVSPDGGILIGIDLKKDRSILEHAYNDSQNLSAAFALNLLTRINRELSANFALDLFQYFSFYNEDKDRIEMMLVSKTLQRVRIGDHNIEFQAGDSLRTENSYKFEISQFQSILQNAGFQTNKIWVDPQRLFSVFYASI